MIGDQTETQTETDFGVETIGNDVEGSNFRVRK